MSKQTDDKRPSSPSLVSIKDGHVQAVRVDDEQLHDLGYEQKMKRGFTMWSMTAFCLTGLGLLPSLGGEIRSANTIRPFLMCRQAPFGTALAI